MIRRSPDSRPLFSLGYQLRHLPEFLGELTSAGVQVVIDVRETPWSHKPGFSKRQLEPALTEVGISYLHASFAGNPKQFRRDAADHEECLERYDRHLKESPEILSALSSLIDSLEQGAAVCFICYERHPKDCHRSILLERWGEHLGRDLLVRHLGPTGAPRLIK